MRSLVHVCQLGGLYYKMSAIGGGAKQAAASARHRSVFVRPADFPLRDVRQTVALTRQVVRQAARKGSERADASQGVKGLVAMHFPRVSD